MTACGKLHASPTYDNVGIYVAIKQCTHFWRLSCKNNLHTPSRKFLQVRVCGPEGFNFFLLFETKKKILKKKFHNGWEFVSQFVVVIVVTNSSSDVKQPGPLKRSPQINLL